MIKPAYTAFANFLANGHDHKGAQLSEIVYSNGTVKHDGFSCATYLTAVI
jgi:hypothetical protein